MIVENELSLPQTIEEFRNWDSNIGYKYEWFNDELIKFSGLRTSELYIYFNLSRNFVEQQLHKIGCLVCKQDVDLSPMQMRRPDIAFFTKGQGKNMKEDVDEVPQFAVEIISKNDNFNNVKAKLEEYFKYGVMVVWIIIPELKKIRANASK